MVKAAQSPVNEGNYARFLKEPYCFNCTKVPATKLMRCSRCQVAWYCSVPCQKEHYPGNHRKSCLRIAQIKKRKDQEESMLRSTPIRPFIGTENVFETDTGNFWVLDQTYAYMQASFVLVESYWDAAYNSEVKELWEKALFHNLEHLRLGAADYMCVRLGTPFILLFLDRDDDACTFIEYWARSPAILLDANSIFDIHFNSKEGDWIYPRKPNCRYSDICDEILNRTGIQEVKTFFLVALAIVKFRVVAEHDAVSQSVDLAFEGATGQRIQEVQSTVKGMLVRKDIDMESQRQQLDRILDAIHLHNPSVLPAMINPTPITEQPCPHPVTPGHPSEVYDTLAYSRRCLVQIPGALDILKERFGSNPVYNWNMAA